MLQQNGPSDYVLATGETHTVREFLDIAFGQLDLNPDDRVEIDSRYYRPTAVNLLLGDSARAQADLTWTANTSFQSLVALIVDADYQLACGDSAQASF